MTGAIPRLGACRSVLAGRQLVRLQHQPLDPPAVLDVRLQDLVDIGRVLIAIPYPLGVDDHVRAEFAAVETAGAVASDILDPELLRLGAGIGAQFLDPAESGGAGIAGAARMTLGPLVVAEEKMAPIEQPRVARRV